MKTKIIIGIASLILLVIVGFFARAIYQINIATKASLDADAKITDIHNFIAAQLQAQQQIK